MRGCLCNQRWCIASLALQQDTLSFVWYGLDGSGVAASLLSLKKSFALSEVTVGSGMGWL
jgi:hypothetical protein